tara:strand:+ start:9023 stop:9196 length:174 start_codon:yes stop_codon:yes gene_type:complete
MISEDRDVDGGTLGYVRANARVDFPPANEERRELVVDAVAHRGEQLVVAIVRGRERV